MNKTVIWVIVAIVVLGTAYWYYTNSQSGGAMTDTGTEGEIMEGEAMTE
jgi:hypothetical protein